MKLICCIFGKIKYNKIIISALVVLVMANIMINGSTVYTFDFGNEKDSIADMTEDAECIIITSRKTDYFVIEPFASEIFYSDKFFFTNLDEIDDNMKNIDELKTDKHIYLFIDSGACNTDSSGEQCITYSDGNINMPLEKFLNNIQSLNIANECVYITDYTISYRNFYIYRLA